AATRSTASAPPSSPPGTDGDPTGPPPSAAEPHLGAGRVRRSRLHSGHEPRRLLHRTSGEAADEVPAKQHVHENRRRGDQDRARRGQRSTVAARPYPKQFTVDYVLGYRRSAGPARRGITEGHPRG